MFRYEHLEASPAHQATLRAHGLETVEKVFQTVGEVVTHTRTTEVRRVTLRTPAGETHYYLKLYWVNRPAQLWKGMFRGTLFGRAKVRREFRNLETVRAAGLDAPEPIAFGIERRFGWITRSFLISAGVPDPMPLHEFIREKFPAATTSSGQPERATLIENLARYTRRLHEGHFVHHDYFWRNILLTRGDIAHFYLVDSHKGRRWWPWQESRSRAADLAALDAPAARFFRRTERLRFFLVYRGHRHLDAGDKELLRRTLSLAAPMREAQTRRALHALHPRLQA